MDTVNMNHEDKQIRNTLFGTLEVEGINTFYVYLIQVKTMTRWLLVDRNSEDIKIVAALKINVTGTMEGFGRTDILMRLTESIAILSGRCVASDNLKIGFGTKGTYKDESTGYFIDFKLLVGSRLYHSIDLSHEGFKLSLSKYHGKVPTVPKEMHKIPSPKDKAAIVSNLGIKSAALLKRTYGERLHWYEENGVKKKDYRLVDTVEKFREMMLNFVQAVQTASDKGKSVLVGLDTETTGLNMYNLSANNVYRDKIVAIPFAWEDDKAYLICIDMYYFSNVDVDEVYPLFTKLLSRNADYSFQDIELEYCGHLFKFNRKHITVGGHNVFFDEQAFFTEDCDVFFDEDGQILIYNMATDWVQGKNSLKANTRRISGDETLELDELFGAAHKDKFKYLQDPELALMYGCADADYTRKEIKFFLSMIPKHLHRMYRKYDMTACYKAANASWHGMPMNTEEVRRQGEDVKEDLETLKEFIYRYSYEANKSALENQTGRLMEILGIEGVAELKTVSEGDKTFRYPFTPTNHKKLLFGILNYPVVKMSSENKSPAMDSYVLNKLASVKRDKPLEFLLENIPSKGNYDVNDKADKGLLINKDKFNSLLYPLAYVFLMYAKLNKEYTSYYKPIVENDLEGKSFYGMSFARAATRRILSPGQTMKGSLKNLVIAPAGNLFMTFDARQIEYVHMASLAYIRKKRVLQKTHPEDWELRLAETNIAKICGYMKLPESDYHIETASQMTGLPRHKIDKSIRGRWKRVGFGIPYGLGLWMLCEGIFGDTKPENLKLTQELLDDYYIKQAEIMELLESSRDSAFIPCDISDKFREYLGIGDTHVGMVKNFTGFYRMFILEDLTRATVGSIRRKSGNCVFQGGAAELFRRMLYNFNVGCVEAEIDQYVQWLMLVHDEVDSLVDSKVDILKLIKTIHTNCTLTYEDHIPYYVGIGFGRNWGEAKDDAAELPIIMVERLIKAYDEKRIILPSDGNQDKNLLKMKRHYMCDRIHEELDTIIPSLSKGFEWNEELANKVDDQFTNYMVRAYLSSFKLKGEPNNLLNNLKAWQSEREQFGFGRDFTTEKFESGLLKLNLESTIKVQNLDLSEVAVDLLDDSDDLSLEGEGTWLSEDNLFDHSADYADIDAEARAEGHKFFKVSEEEEVTEVLNENPTSAFDVYISTKYIKTNVLTVKEGVYTVYLRGTDYLGRERQLASQIKRELASGSDTINIIGIDSMKVSNVDANQEKLEWLDRLVTSRNERVQEDASTKQQT